MKSISYYRLLSGGDNNFFSDETFFQVNCTGHSFYNCEVKAHAVRHDYYLMYILGGTIYLNAPEQERPICMGDMIIFKPETFFNYFKPDGVDMEYYWVHFTGYGAQEFLRQCGLETNHIKIVGRHEEICEGFRRLFNVFLTRDKLFNADSHSELSSLLVSIAKYSSKQGEDFPNNYMKINKALSYIHHNISQAITVEALAATEHMSESYFRAVFNNITGLSPQKYITLSKLNYSCRLLRQTDLNIKQIGAMVGYTDPQYFSRIFKKNFNLSPISYRNKPL